MRIIKNDSLIVADKVLVEVKKLMKTYKDKTGAAAIDVQCWSNGREQGYAIHIYSRTRSTVCFARQRNSNDIVVCYGKSSKFDYTTNIPNEDVWHNARREFESVHLAGYFIAGYIKSAIEHKSE